jgi:hypothetical protein
LFINLSLKGELYKLCLLLLSQSAKPRPPWCAPPDSCQEGNASRLKGGQKVPTEHEHQRCALLSWCDVIGFRREDGEDHGHARNCDEDGGSDGQDVTFRLTSPQQLNFRTWARSCRRYGSGGRFPSRPVSPSRFLNYCLRLDSTMYRPLGIQNEVRWPSSYSLTCPFQWKSSRGGIDQSEMRPTRATGASRSANRRFR